eukprot:Blabericola_migrator_1__3471@NODE_2026_length_3392_cov_191_048421_g1287_i0_p2_GENE_NODE_2026_length_3392_cov_191_048421_g1287_i0NODE_2026_length_3392_cov_191_048421_g1287_i0_p2_ORF_typecomplete_len172_score14_08_NODE_2026_length_3392_cov_191_048421_g1287_i05661081
MSQPHTHNLSTDLTSLGQSQALPQKSPDPDYSHLALTTCSPHIIALKIVVSLFDITHTWTPVAPTPLSSHRWPSNSILRLLITRPTHCRTTGTPPFAFHARPVPIVHAPQSTQTPSIAAMSLSSPASPRSYTTRFTGPGYPVTCLSQPLAATSLRSPTMSTRHFVPRRSPN